MSSHRISVSGARPYTLQAGGGPSTGITFPSKKSDALHAQLSGFKRIEIPLTTVGVRIETRRGTRKGSKGDAPWTYYVLVLGDDEHIVNGVQAYGWPNGEGEMSGPENTSLDLRPEGEVFGPDGWLEDVEVIASVSLVEIVPPAE